MPTSHIIARNEVILIADGDPDARQIYTKFLRYHGFHVVAVASGRDALVAGPAVDAIVTELMLPGDIDGVELIERLKSDDRTRAIPVIVATACAWTTDRHRARTAGCDLFLSKPCLPHELMDAIVRLLARRRLHHRAKPVAHPTRRPHRMEKHWRLTRRTHAASGKTERDIHRQ
jgi:CheY-like chemotaxis protein